jgi:two-component system sensor histidine kinase VanS
VKKGKPNKGKPDKGKPGAAKAGFARKRGIFVKVFGYTLSFLVLMFAVTALLFARQFLAFYRADQARQLSGAFQPLIDRIERAEPAEIAAIAGDFHEKNQSFRFRIEDSEGRVLYSGGFEADGGAAPDGASLKLVFLRHVRDGSGYTLRGDFSASAPVDYGALTGKILLALALMLVFCVAGAVVFARRITLPIMRLAADTRLMAKLKEVPAPLWRNDEIGQLARDIYDMYGALKKTIANLELEVERERAMEENQRAFFSAASHELKTPIAATRALTEGMLSNVGEYRDHRKYLRECLGLLDAQNRLVSEILELVNLADRADLPDRAEARGEPRFEAVDLAELTAALIAEYAPIAERRRQKLSSAVSAAPVRADRGLLGRVLSNVLSNALRNSPEGETIRVWDERRGAALLRLHVFNPGAGLGEDTARLFEPFYRRDPARTGGRNGQGDQGARSGLGLAIVKRALEGMRIPYALQNAEGGVLFWMDLSLAPGPAP